MLIDPTNRGSRGFFNYKFKDASGRQDRSQVRKIQAHSDIVTDFAFSPFDDGLIVTGSQAHLGPLFSLVNYIVTSNASDLLNLTQGSWHWAQDQTIKLWRLPEPGSLISDLSEPELELPEQPRRVETVSWHPLADCLLVRTSSAPWWRVSWLMSIIADHLVQRQPQPLGLRVGGTGGVAGDWPRGPGKVVACWRIWEPSPSTYVNRQLNKTSLSSQ